MAERDSTLTPGIRPRNAPFSMTCFGFCQCMTMTETLPIIMHPDSPTSGALEVSAVHMTLLLRRVPVPPIASSSPRASVQASTNCRMSLHGLSRRNRKRGVPDFGRRPR